MDNNDKYNLKRFIDAQDDGDMYEQALKEINSGLKTGHWIWFIFPQHVSLGQSKMSAFYGIRSSAEAKAYLENDTLKTRLLKICTALYTLESGSLINAVGYVDYLKIRSCCTLFGEVAPQYEIFYDIIRKHCMDIPCYRTIGFIKRESAQDNNQEDI